MTKPTNRQLVTSVELVYSRKIPEKVTDPKTAKITNEHTVSGIVLPNVSSNIIVEDHT